ncbi:MAG: hypothetical protein H6581_24640 [Bacteroidia bacterium]|nr:hypothetical protein [Bacteroidia bacterium]
MNKNLESQAAPYANDLKKMAKPRMNKKSKTLNSAEKQLVNTAIKCYNNFAKTNQGRQVLANLNSQPAEEMSKNLTTMAKSSEFGELFALITKLDNMVDWPIKSVSIGINFSIELVIGFAGTLGVAINPSNLTGDTVAFLGLGVDEGVDEGAMGGIQVGLWTTEPEDMKGWSIGVEISVDDVVGGTAGAYWSFDGTFLGIAVTPGGGEEDGIDVKESYTWILANGALGIPPIYQPPAKHFLIFKKIKAVNIAGGDGSKNEIYFKFTPDGGATYPYPSWDYVSMAEGDEWKCGRSVRFNNSVKVKLYDADDGGDDNLGEVTIKLSDLKIGDETTIKIKSSHGIDDRDFHLYTELIY